ncbi:MAG: hypothetical protein JW847_08470 [Candidatus Omnitrophica bacterium]|nr:hypothetical protein [Candidatus Omnitrophota bacterium]
MKRICLLVLCGLLVMMVVGCNTLKGFGDDISTVGHWITGAWDRATN